MGNLFDTVNYPTTEPSKLVAGDRWVWKRTDLGVDYPPASYALTYSCRLEGTTTAEIEITTSESGNDYIVEIAAATTAAYTVGIYHWQAYIIRASDSERVTVDSGTFEVAPDRDTDTGDPRTHVKITLDAVEAVLEKRATKGQESLSIQGRTLVRTPNRELREFRTEYRALYVKEVRAERIANGLGHSGKIRVRL